jgi:hypothetical protein
LKRLGQQGLIEVITRGWKKGKSKPCFITNTGIKWLINTSLNDTLNVLSKIVNQLKTTETRNIFQRANAERYKQNVRITKDYFIEKSLKGDKSPIEYPIGLDLTDLDEAFRQTLKKLLALHLYLISDFIKISEDPEVSIENDFILFAPHMRFLFSWHPGAFPDLEYQLQRVEKHYQSESQKLEKQNEKIYTETHLLGLERVDEKIYAEYLNAPTEKKRKKIMAKIEDVAGWSVGKYMEKLFKGKTAEIAKYVDENEQPYLRKFISLFEN